MKLILNPNNAMKKAVILSVFVIFGSVVNVCGYDFEVDGICYNITSDSTVSVTYRNTSYNSYSGNVIIPSTVSYQGSSFNVTSVGYYAFRMCHQLDSVIIPNNVYTIGGGAFSYCTNMKSVIIPNSVCHIGGIAFISCNSLTSISLPNSIDSILKSTFDHCGVLSYIKLPDSLQYIGDRAFLNCLQLTQVNIPNSLISIGYAAFNNCSRLNNILLPSGVRYVGGYAFFGTAISQPLYNNSVFAYMPTSFSGSFDIPEGILEISEGSFSGCVGLSNVIIPNSVARIGNQAFNGCTGLITVTIPNSVVNLGDFTFIACSNLRSIYFKRDAPPISSYFDFTNITLFVPCGSTNTYKSYFGLQSDSTINEFNSHNLVVMPSCDSCGIAEVSSQATCNQPATLFAAANEHYHFVSWSDGVISNPRIVYVTSDTAFIAVFKPKKYAVSSNINLVLGTGIYDFGTTVSLIAHSDNHARFLKWSNGVEDSVYSFVLMCDTTIEAIYDLDSFNISATCEHGVVTGYGVYRYPDVVTLTVEPDKGYRFVEWSDGNGYNPRVFVAEEDLTIEAICEEAPEVGVDDVKDNYPQFYVVGNIIYNSANELLRVYSASGKLLQQSEINIELTSYPSGVYIVVDERGNDMKVLVNNK